MDKKIFIKKLNKSSFDDFPIIKMSDLKLNNTYCILDACKVKTKFGQSIIINIRFKTKTVKLFLPSKFGKLTNDEVKNLIGVEFTYKGTVKNNNFDCHQIEFISDIESENENQDV